MIKKIISIVILVLALSFSACEKDDICVDGDTPLLVITFFDFENPLAPKPVANLRIIGLGQTSTVDTFTDRTALDSIGIPLNTATPSTAFIMIDNSVDDENGVDTGNFDTLTFSYDRKEVYISRACGFVANYDSLSTDFQDSPENWIQRIEIDTTLIENSASSHVKIFH